VLSKRKDGLIHEERSISAVVTNNTGKDIQFKTVMKNGKEEVKNACLPAGFAVVIQADGEINVQVDKNGKPTHNKLYDLENPLSVETAFIMAATRGLTLPNTAQIDAALFELSVDSSLADLPWVYAVSKGRVIPYRVDFQIDLAKPSWGPGGGQSMELDSCMVVNVLTNEVYCIGRSEFVMNWVQHKDQSLNATDLWAKIPLITEDQLSAMAVEEETE